jgi:peptidoglycan/LPS O-acetylase OafA/YrhL
MTIFKNEPNWKVKPWVLSLDPLRGITALAVVVHHAAQAWRITANGTSISATMFAWLGGWGVTLFFVLSGFCIHLTEARAFTLNRHQRALTVLLAMRRYRELPAIIGVPTTVVLANFTSWVFFLLIERHFLSVRQRTAEPLLTLSAASPGRDLRLAAAIPSTSQGSTE